MMWVLVVLMIVPDGFDYRMLATSGAPSSGGALSRFLWMALLACGSLVLLWRFSLAWLLARALNPFLILLVALAVLSISWSIDPSLSARRLIRLATIVLACAAFVLVCWHERRFQNVIRPILTLMLAGSIVFGLVYPQLAIHQETSAELAGAWRGLANHKNGLGALAGMGMILWFHAWQTQQVSRGRALAGCALALACLVLSRSTTSMASTMFVLLLMLVLLRRPPTGRPTWQPILVGLLLCAVLLYALAVLDVIPGLGTLVSPLAALTSKDATLTGRTQIWEILADHIRLHPLLGTGYGAYWTADPSPGMDSFEFIRRMNSFYPGSAHNGYLEVVNDLGWIGFCCLLGYIIVHARQCLKLLTPEYSQACLYLALLFQQAVTNLSESHWFSVLSVDFVVMTLASMAVARALLDQRMRAWFGAPSAGAVRPYGLSAT